MEKREFRLLACAGVLYLVLVLISSFFPGNPYGFLLSPVGSFGGAAILLYISRKGSRPGGFALLLGLACLAWGAADVLQVLYGVIWHKDTLQIELLQFAYLPGKVLVAAALGFNLMSRRKSWNVAQILTDILAVSICGMSIIWFLLFEDEMPHLQQAEAVRISVFITLLCDTVIFSFLWACAVSFREKKSPPRKIILFALFGNTFTDFYCAYQRFTGSYVPNTITDFLLTASFMAAVLGCLWDFYRGDSAPTAALEEHFNSFKNRYKGVVLLTCPFLMLIWNRYKLEDIVMLLTIAAAYQVISGFIYSEYQKEKQLEKEREKNQRLHSDIRLRTQELNAVSEQLGSMTYQDTMSGMGNRRTFQKVLAGMLQQPFLGNMVLLYGGLDRFKAINEAYGHETGDEVLAEIGRRIEMWNQQNGLLARMGGDEFAVAIPEKYDSRAAAEIARHLLVCCGRPIRLKNLQIQLTVSIGISFYPEDAGDDRSLVQNANLAMRCAKQHGGGEVAFYNEKMNRKIRRDAELEMLLRQAEFGEEFELYYQPQFRISDHRLVGAEALIRWNSPEKGRIMPDEFIPIAEETGVIVPLGAWIMRRAMQQGKAWNKRYPLGIKIGINVCSRQMDGAKFVAQVKRELLANSLQGSMVDLEITESIAMQDEYRVLNMIQELGKAGISISIDDFGTGYSSLSRLKQFPVQRIKIAKPMVDHIVEDERDANILKAIVFMAKALNLQVIAEGVEEDAQLALLREIGCDEIQGYLWGRPVCAREFEELYFMGKEAGVVS